MCSIIWVSRINHHMNKSSFTLLYVGKFGPSRNSENLGSLCLKGKNDSIEREYAKWVACDGNKTVIFDQIIIMQKILKS